MSILVTGATGTVGSLVTQGLADAGAQVKALVRQQGKRSFPAGVTEVVADLTDAHPCAPPWHRCARCSC